MKERPILFNAAMVNAILAGRKTQTRRVVKPQPPETHSFGGYVIEASPRKNEGKFKWGIKKGEYHFADSIYARCPYGQPSDRLWVRESWSGEYHMAGIKPSRRIDYPDEANHMPVLPVTWYWADGEPESGDWERPRPSIHMPRWASRITLEIVSVRVERLQDISAKDAAQEGVSFGRITDQATGEIDRDACEAFEELWQSINGAESWDANPWVWVVEFERIQENAQEAA
jgi:hypothetical protein